MNTTTDYHVEIEDLYKSYGNKQVLNDIDLRVRKGEFVSIVGPSGCGKSTLLRLILGQERPTSAFKFLHNGLWVQGADTSRGVVYQKYGLFPHLTVLENVMMGSRLNRRFIGLPKASKEDKEKALAYLSRVRLKESDAKKYPHELSGGMQQRVAIAQSMITEPEILLMDEPFGALDPGTREDLQLFLSELWEQTGMTVFFITHDLEEAQHLGTRLLVVSQFYSTGDEEGVCKHNGSKIVWDVELKKEARPASYKDTAEFGEMLREIRKHGFDPEYLQHVEDFKLTHKDSFQTIDEDELRPQ